MEASDWKPFTGAGTPLLAGDVDSSAPERPLPAGDIDSAGFLVNVL